jgi:hypothetical protein
VKSSGRNGRHFIVVGSGEKEVSICQKVPRLRPLVSLVRGSVEVKTLQWLEEVT